MPDADRAFVVVAVSVKRRVCDLIMSSKTFLFALFSVASCAALACSGSGDPVGGRSPGSGGGTSAGGGPATGDGEDNGPTIVPLPPGASKGCNRETGEGCDDGEGTYVPACSNGVIDRAQGEVCDDGNSESGDGCTGNCDQIEEGFACPTPGAACVFTVECGDAKLSVGENCDDGNEVSGDGCSDKCTVEEGWSCPIAGIRCQAASCGDGIVVGNEECDFAAATAGCVNCQVDDRYACDTNGCHRTTCGDGVAEGSEACDDGNNDWGDGCTPDCKSEPDCSGSSCVSSCGDGILLPGSATEECDDGNTSDGDGCSARCQVEEGYRCSSAGPGDSITIPVVYRDFIGVECDGYNEMPAGGCDAKPGAPEAHPDFNQVPSGPGILDWQTDGTVKNTLGSDGKPDYSHGEGPFATAQSNGTTTGRVNFQWWYRDNPKYNMTVRDTLTLSKSGSGFSFESSTFWPLDDRGWQSAGEERTILNNGDGKRHNYHFTSEVRYWFEFDANTNARPVLTFRGDDDVWVFINKKLTVDIGGIHPQIEEKVTLTKSGDGRVVTFDHTVPDKTVDLGLEHGKVYEIVVFQAERRWSGSNYKLTLQGFNAGRSQCETVCGDGFVTPDELCDDGTNNGSYNGCQNNCQARGPYCGDAKVQSEHGEDCDDGLNLSEYGSGCAPGCVTAPTCGDGVVQSRYEACDDGENSGGYGACTESCQLGPRCGDGIVQDGHETCDDGNRKGADGCDPACRVESAR